MSANPNLRSVYLERLLSGKPTGCSGSKAALPFGLPHCHKDSSERSTCSGRDLCRLKDI